MFNANATYQSERNVRGVEYWVELVQQAPPEGALWCFLGTPRSGKTWFLHALAEGLPKRSTRYLDLRQPADESAFYNSKIRKFVLLDEPARLLEKDAERFLDRCRELRGKHLRHLVLALPPAQYERLRQACRDEATVHAKDLHFLQPLSPSEARRKAERDGAPAWIGGVFDGLPDEWRQNPFLLELVFETAERFPELRHDVTELLLRTADRANQELKYAQDVMQKGLAAGQADTLRDIACGRVVSRPAAQPLIDCHLVDWSGTQPEILDPAIAAYLPPPPLIHHLSDLHVGPKSGKIVDDKDPSGPGRKFAEGLGAGFIRDGYLQHLGELPAQRRAPHLVIFSGDAVETGRDEQYTQAAAWFTRLREALAPQHPRLRDGDPRVLIVGGNHDVSWNQVLGAEGARQRH